jgi:uncharacterized membrane protein YraQ (UPF0718 family)
MAMMMAQGAGTLRRRLVKSALVVCVIIWAADIVYRLTKDISYVNREQCVLFRALPRPGFLVWEYFFETLVVVFVGTFLAVWLSRQFVRLRRFMPTNPVTAFLYGAVVPVCSCGVIPLAGSMRERLGLTTTVALVLAAPLLSPYIMVLSFSVLGTTYGLLRIGAAFVLTMVCASAVSRIARVLPPGAVPIALPAVASLGAAGEAYVLPGVGRRGIGQTGLGPGGMRSLGAAAAGVGCARQCAAAGDIYLETLRIVRGLAPYLAVAAAIGLGLEYLGPRQFLLRGAPGSGPGEVIVWALVGMPLYFCNGAEVLFLRPLVSHGLPLGTAIAFSLTSTAVCITSMAMLFKVIGARLTLALTACVTASAIGLAFVINWLV